MDRHFRQRNGVEQQRIGADGEPRSGQRAGQQRCLEDVDAVDQFRADERDRPGDGVLAGFRCRGGAVLRA